MARPVETLLHWANSVSAEKVEPAAKESLGWEIVGGAGESPYLEHMNYLFYNQSSWLKWVVDEGLVNLEATTVKISSPASDANTASFLQRNATGVVAQSTLEGTANRITVTPSAGKITLNLPQDIHSSATPTFGGITINGNITVTGTVDSVDIAAFKSAYDAYVDTGSSHTWSGLTLTTLSVPATGASFTGSLGTAVSSANVLQRNGSNVLTSTTLTGTSNQVTVTPSSGAVTFSLPQDVHTGATPTFAGATLTGFSGVVKASAGVLSAAALVNADVHASAAIDGTKISPNFGSQNISTSGTLTSSNISSGAYLNQDTRTSASPTFAGATLTAFSGVVKASAGVLSASSIVNADINAAAAIDGTKISPNFGAQAIQTTGTATVNKLVVNGNNAYDAIMFADVDSAIRVNNIDTIGNNETMSIGSTYANVIYIGRTGGDVYLQGTIHGTVVATNYDYLTVSSAAPTGTVDNISDFAGINHIKSTATNSTSDAKIYHGGSFLNSGAAGIIYHRPDTATTAVRMGLYTSPAGVSAGDIRTTPTLLLGESLEVQASTGYQTQDTLQVDGIIASGYTGRYDNLTVGTGRTYTVDGSLVSHIIDNTGTGSIDVSGDIDEVAPYFAPAGVNTSYSNILVDYVIDGDVNTISDIGLSSIKVDAGSPRSVLVRDSSGAVVNSSTNVGGIKLSTGATADRATGSVTGIAYYNTTTGTLQIGKGTDTWADLVETGATQTLTGKTIDGDNNTLSDIGIASLKAVPGNSRTMLVRDSNGIVVDTATNIGGVLIPTGGSGSRVSGIDVTGYLYFNTSAGFLQVGKGVDTWVTLVETTASQTLTTKTIDGASNTLTNIALSSMASGTANYVMTYNGSGVPTAATIVNANVNASAAIAGTKISPDFGAQTVTTTGTVAGNRLVTTNATSADVTVVTGTTLRQDNVVIGSTHLYTVNSGGAVVAHNVDDASGAGSYGLDVAGNVDEVAPYVAPLSVSGGNPLTLGDAEPGSVSSSTSGTAGIASTAARADHSHDLSITTFLASAEPGSVSSATSGTAGVASTAARSDHSHDLSITAFLASAEPGSVSNSTSGTVGTSGNVAREDHSHDLGTHTHTDTASGGLIVAASATQQGAVTTGTQSFAGAKTFTGNVAVQGTLQLSSGGLALKQKWVYGSFAISGTTLTIAHGITDGSSKIQGVFGICTSLGFAIPGPVMATAGLRHVAVEYNDTNIILRSYDSSGSAAALSTTATTLCEISIWFIT